MARPLNELSAPARAALVTAMLATSFAAAVGLFEVGLRLAGYEPIYEIYSKPSMFWRYDELLGWSHEPGARGEYVGPRPWPIEFRGRISINSQGLRGPEIAAPDPSQLRVLFAGDSMVAAFEVDHEHTFVARLQDMLRDRLGVDVLTINAGVRGYGTDQSYLYYRERGWKLEPDLVVFYHSGNDPSDNTTLHEMRRPFGKPALSPGPDGLDLVGAPVPRYPSCSEVLLTPKFGAQRADTALGRWLCRAQMTLFDHSALFSYLTLAIRWDSALLQRLYYLGNPHAEHLIRAAERNPESSFSGRLTTAIVLAFAEEVRRRGADLLLAGFETQLDQVDLDAIAAAGIDVISLRGLDGEPLRWHHDAHFNPQGHEVLAGMMLPELESRLRSRAEALRRAE